ELRLRLLEPFGVELLDGVGSPRDERVGVFVRSEIREHVIGRLTRIPAPRAADADAQAQELRSLEMCGDRAKPVVARQATTAASLQASRLEIDLVVDDEDRVGLELEEAGCRTHGSTRLVHERLGFQQSDAVTVE